MKKVWCILFACNVFAHTAYAQIYSIVDMRKSSQRFSLATFSSIKFDDHSGIFCNLEKDKDMFDYGAGVFFSTSSMRARKKHRYYELGLGMGATKTLDGSVPTKYYTQGYLWYEDHPDQISGEGKVIVQANPALTFGTQDPWYLYLYATYGLTRYVALRGQYLTGSAKGIGIEFNLPIHETFMFKIYGITGIGSMLGMSFIFQH